MVHLLSELVKNRTIKGQQSPRHYSPNSSFFQWSQPYQVLRIIAIFLKTDIVYLTASHDFCTNWVIF